MCNNKNAERLYFFNDFVFAVGLFCAHKIKQNIRCDCEPEERCKDVAVLSLSIFGKQKVI